MLCSTRCFCTCSLVAYSGLHNMVISMNSLANLVGRVMNAVDERMMNLNVTSPEEYRQWRMIKHYGKIMEDVNILSMEGSAQGVLI